MLQGDTLSAFLREDWHRHPRIFRGAINASTIPVTAEEICQLTSQEVVESRLIEDDYAVTHGPFDFISEPGKNLLREGQMLMVQCLEQHLEAADQLIVNDFSFLPRWQIDDVMASIGYTGANCGAHFDQYDVFLVQLSGSKIWHLDRQEHVESELGQDLEIRLLQHFEPVEKFLLEPGDVLYIPPGIGHHGICQGESVTLSVGIRNPTTTEMLAELSEFAIEQTEAHAMATTLHAAGSGIDPGAASELQSSISTLLDHQLFLRWYGCYVTRLRDPDVLAPQPLHESLSGCVIAASLPTRLTWSEDDGSLLLFVNGDCYELPVETKLWAVELCEKRQVSLPPSLDEHSVTALQELIVTGALRSL